MEAGRPLGHFFWIFWLSRGFLGFLWSKPKNLMCFFGFRVPGKAKTKKTHLFLASHPKTKKKTCLFLVFRPPQTRKPKKHVGFDQRKPKKPRENQEIQQNCLPASMALVDWFLVFWFPCRLSEKSTTRTRLWCIKEILVEWPPGLRGFVFLVCWFLRRLSEK